MNDSDPPKSEHSNDKSYLAMLLTMMLLFSVVFVLDWWGGGRVPSQVYSVIALAVLAVIVLLAVRLVRHRFQFSLRALLLFVLVASTGLGWLGSKVQPIRNERNAVTEIRGMGGTVTWGLASGGYFSFETRLKPKTGFDQWIRRLFGGRPVAANSVELWNTGVTDADMANLKYLLDVELLNLDNTQITDTGLAHLAGLKNLQVLTLSKTRVTDAGLKHLKELKNLRRLWLHNTEITDAGLVHLAGLKNLQWLTYSDTLVTEEGVKGLRSALPELGVYPRPPMQMLSHMLSQNAAVAEASRLNPGHGEAISKISTLLGGKFSVPPGSTRFGLELVGTHVNDEGLEYVKGLATLRLLMLHGTGVTDAGLEHLKGLTNLETLHLCDTQITNAGLEHLEGLTSLQELHLRGTQVTDEGVKKLQQALPECEIEH